MGRKATILVWLLMSASCTRTSRELAKVAPRQVAAWTASGPGRTVDTRRIFELLDGGAEIYLDYGVRRVFAQTYRRARGAEIVLYVFEMRSSADAFGIFSHERAGRPAGIGQGSDWGEGLLRFWKGRYFVSIQTDAETKVAARAVHSLAAHLAGKLPGGGRKPRMLAWLPEDGLAPDSVRYLHTHQALLHHLVVAPENVLGLSRRTEVVTAAYGAGPHRVRALLVRYPHAREAARAAKALAGVPFGRRAATRACGAVLLVVGGRGSSPRAAGRRTSLLAGIAARVPACSGG